MILNGNILTIIDILGIVMFCVISWESQNMMIVNVDNCQYKHSPLTVFWRGLKESVKAHKN